MTRDFSPRERVLAAIRHEEPDRVPIDFGSSHVSSIHLRPYNQLKEHFGVKTEPPIIHRMLQVVLPDERIIESLRSDTRGVFLGAPDNWQDIELPDDTYVDEWGIVRRKPQHELGFYYDQVGAPLDGDSITSGDLDQFRWPDPDDPGRYRDLHRQVEEQKAKGDYAIVLNFGGSFVHRAQYIRGMQNWFQDLILNPDLSYELMERIVDIFIRMADLALAEIGNDIDVISIGDDLASQTALMMSPEVYRKLIKPLQAKLIGFIKSRTRAYVKFHSCGSIVEIIDDLADVGVDIINPVQVSAVGMDSAELKWRFGGKVTFWGAIDTQKVLPYGTPDDVRNEVKKRISDLAPGGGYVVAAVNNIQPGVSPENILAMFEAAYQYGCYPIAAAS